MTGSEQDVRDALLRDVAAAWPTASIHLDDWHPDDVALYYQGEWKSFQERAEAVLRQRQARVVSAVLLFVESEIKKQLMPLCSVGKDKGGYDCCGCSVYETIVDDATKLVHRMLEANSD